jgi:hypothetical protein
MARKSKKAHKRGTEYESGPLTPGDTKETLSPIEWKLRYGKVLKAEPWPGSRKKTGKG